MSEPGGPTTSPLVSAAALRSMIERGDQVVTMDVRWALEAGAGAAAYAAGHLPGAHFVDLEVDLARPPQHGEGRHPLPAKTQVAALLRRCGVTDRHLVVSYDDNGGLSATRAWWVLRWAGVRRAAVLDGGVQEWIAADGHLTTEVPPDGEGTMEVVTDQMPTLTAAEALRYAAQDRLYDARSSERFRGRSEPVDPVAGHIPGAKSVPASDNLSHGRFRPASELRRRFDALGSATEIGVYCGSGVTAAHLVLALELVGRSGVLYPGSWSEWIADPSRPIATESDSLEGS